MHILLLTISRLLFDLALWFSKEDRHPFPIEYLQPYQKCTFGIFIKHIEKNNIILGMFANPQIGFFFKDTVFEEEIIEFPFTKKASKTEVEEIRKYLVDKIVEGHKQLELLEQDEIQSDFQNKQAISSATGEASWQSS